MSHMLSEEIADYIAGRGLGTVSTEDAEGDIWLERLPLLQKDGLYIVTLPGNEPDKYLDTCEDVLMFYTRHTDGTVAFKKLRDVFNVLHRASNFDTPNFHVYFANAQGGIQYIDTDLNDGMIYSLGIKFIYRDVNIIS